jgi:hypothetical protein
VFSLWISFAAISKQIFEMRMPVTSAIQMQMFRRCRWAPVLPIEERRFRYVAVFWAALQATAGLYEALMDAIGVNSNTADKRGHLAVAEEMLPDKI